MKKIIPFMLVFLLALMACGKKEDEALPSNVPPPKNVTAPVSSETKTAKPTVKRPPPPSPAKQAYSRETRSATRPGMILPQGKQNAAAGYMQCPKSRPNRSVGIVPYRCENGVALMNVGMCGVTLQAAGPLDGGFFFIGMDNTEEQGIYAGDKGYIQRRGDTIFLYNAQRKHIATCKTDDAS